VSGTCSSTRGQQRRDSWTRNSLSSLSLSLSLSARHSRAEIHPDRNKSKEKDRGGRRRGHCLHQSCNGRARFPIPSSLSRSSCGLYVYYAALLNQHTEGGTCTVISEASSPPYWQSILSSILLIPPTAYLSQKQTSKQLSEFRYTQGIRRS
jgi:hypothetical protein